MELHLHNNNMASLKAATIRVTVNQLMGSSSTDSRHLPTANLNSKVAIKLRVNTAILDTAAPRLQVKRQALVLSNSNNGSRPSTSIDLVTLPLAS